MHQAIEVSLESFCGFKERVPDPTHDISGVEKPQRLRTCGETRVTQHWPDQRLLIRVQNPDWIRGLIEQLVQFKAIKVIVIPEDPAARGYSFDANHPPVQEPRAKEEAGVPGVRS